MIHKTWDTVGHEMCIRWCQANFHVRLAAHHIVSAVHHDEHWIPLWANIRANTLQIHVVDPAPQSIPFLHDMVIHSIRFDLPAHDKCGALTIAFLSHIILRTPLPQTVRELNDLHTELRAAFVAAVYTSEGCRCPVVWGQGPGPLARELAAELLKHGVPESEVENRAAQAIRAIGSEQVQQALAHKQPWRQLKSLANNVRFQFLHPKELADVVAQNRSKPVGKRTKPGVPPKVTKMPQAVDLDPHKLKILDGIFKADQTVIPQILAQQIGPVASGIVLMSHAEADPYLRAGAQVSQEPLALVVIQAPGAHIQTSLPHKTITVPCRCLVDNEPVLLDAVLIQLGRGFVDKVSGHSTVEIEALDVITIKMTTFRDEITGEWDAFCAAPIRYLVSVYPQLKRCDASDCSCAHWHNPDKLPVREPILDVWRRQYLRAGFKPVPATQAEFFAVCLRVPRALMMSLLEQSGSSGIYCEPRSADGRDVLTEFSVIWAAKLSVSELQHLKQTNPGVIGLARMAERRGLRVHASQAQSLHKLLRPDAMFLPQGPRNEFLAGPFPYGVDRHAVYRALKQSGWSTKPLQPAAPVPGRGTMWLIHAVDEPEETILMTSHGEVVISKNRPDTAAKPVVPSLVGSATTLSLCGASASKADDPWSKNDPWGQYQPTSKPAALHAPVCTPTDSMLQMEHRIQEAVLSKIGTSMEDDVPERMTALEQQVQGLLHKQNTLESQFGEYSTTHTHQLNVMQSQIHSQGQQLHGQLESQNQTIQAMFQDQMAQIRGLLAKRPREEGME
eukprot:s1710_g7.t1